MASSSRVLVQYIALRGDLLKTLKWPVGAVVAQACHASIAAIAVHKEEESVKAYIHKDNLGTMHKVVVEVSIIISFIVYCIVEYVYCIVQTLYFTTDILYYVNMYSI